MNHSEEQVRVMIDRIPALTWTYLPDRTNDFLSQRCLNYIGLSLEKSLGCAWKASIHPDDQEKLMNNWLSRITSGQSGEEDLPFGIVVNFRSHPIFTVLQVKYPTQAQAPPLSGLSKTGVTGMLVFEHVASGPY